MPESNGDDSVKNAGLLRHFRYFPWPTQVAIVLSLTSGAVGVPAGLSRFFQPDPVVAEIRDVLEEHRDESRGINASLITKLDSLNTSAGKISNAMFYNICQDSQDSEWLIRLGRRGQDYCASITSNIEREFARGAYK